MQAKEATKAFDVCFQDQDWNRESGQGFIDTSRTSNVIFEHFSIHVPKVSITEYFFEKPKKFSTLR